MEYPRTTVRIEPKLLKAAKKYSQEKNTSLQQVINLGLELLLHNKANPVENITRKPKKFTDKLITLELPKELADCTFDRDFIYDDKK